LARRRVTSANRRAAIGRNCEFETQRQQSLITDEVTRARDARNVNVAQSTRTARGMRGPCKQATFRTDTRGFRVT